MMNLSACNKRSLNLYFQVHQPMRLKNFRFFDIGSNTSYFDEELNTSILRRIADNCYLPTNQMLLELLEKYPSFKVTFSVSGVALEQFEKSAPDVIESFKKLAETGRVEFLGETYFHSLAYFISEKEFVEQVQLHSRKLHEILGVSPVAFRNTELIYSDGIGKVVSDLGFGAIYFDGIEKVLEGRSSNDLYRHPSENLLLIPRNFRLSDDIAFRFADPNWNEWPLTGEKFAHWINSIPADESFVCLGLDYETFGEHKKAHTGIFPFFEQFVDKVSRDTDITFVNPSDLIVAGASYETASTERAVSWADEARDLSAWLGNDLQRNAFHSLYKFHDFLVNSNDAEMLNLYRHLQTSDHFYYMFTKNGNDGSVHQYFSPFKSPHEAFMNFMNIVSDLEIRIKALTKKRMAMEKHGKIANKHALV